MSDDTRKPGQHPFFASMPAVPPAWRNLPPLSPIPPELIVTRSITFCVHSYRPDPVRRSIDLPTNAPVRTDETIYQLAESLPDIRALLHRTAHGDVLYYLPSSRLADLTHIVARSAPLPQPGLRAVNLAVKPFDLTDLTRSLAALDVALTVLGWNARYVTLGSSYHAPCAVVCERPGADPLEIDAAAQEYAYRNLHSASVHTRVRHAY